MKRIGVTVIAVLLLALFSCDVNGKEETKSSGYSFIDQNLMGEHTDKSWELVSGAAEDNSSDNTEFSFNLYNIDPRDGYSVTNSFAYFGEKYNSLIFSIPKEIGLYNLISDVNNSNGNITVTFFDSNTYMNTIAAQGAVEILSIDNTEKTITGRMDVWYGDKSEYHVNGNFTVPFL